MARGVNKVILIGNLGADPEVRYTTNGTAVANFSLATNDRVPAGDGEWEERTEWHRIVTFGKTAENCGNYLAKGRTIYLEGRIQTRQWEDAQGVKRYTTEIVARNIQFLGGGNSDSGHTQQRTTQAAQQQQGRQQPLNEPPADYPEEDIPF